jgi:hypothetical protein
MEEKINSAIRNEADELIKENPEAAIIRSLEIENATLRENCFMLHQILQTQKESLLKWENLSKEIFAFAQKLTLELIKKNDLQ